jgi:hypothetical protein
MAAKYAREVKAILTQRCFCPPPPETVELCEIVYEAAIKSAEALKPAHNIIRDATVLIKSVVACLDDCGTGMSASTVEDCIGMLRKAIDIIAAQQHPC